MAAPPQTMAADFQASALTNSFWLRKEITNVGLLAPFINTTGGLRLKPGGLAWSSPGRTSGKLASGKGGSAFAETVAGGSFSSTARLWYETPAADHASGLVMPARVSAAAILACWLISCVEAGAVPLASLMICGAGKGSEILLGAELPGPSLRGESLSGESRRGENGRTWTPGFSVRVPAMKSVSSGLIERSSTRKRRPGTTPCRERKTLTRGGTS